MRRLMVVPVLWLVGGGCAGKVTTDPSEEGTITPPPVAEFDPANQVVPFPNNLLLDPATGRLALPTQCGETPGSAAETLREELNQLDGFGTSKLSVTATFSEPVDLSSLADHVFLFRLATAGVPTDGREGPVPLDVSLGHSFRGCPPTTVVDNVTLQPRMPLAGKSTYVVALLRGIKTATGTEFQPSVNWALVRQSTEPVQFSSTGSVTYNATPFDPTNPNDLLTLQGLDLLWKAHAPVLQFFDAALPVLTGTNAPVPRDQVLLAWSFNTETISDPFDPAVTGSPASQLTTATAPDAPNMPPIPAAGDGATITVEQFYASAVPSLPCTLAGCAAIGAIYTGLPGLPSPSFVSPSFQKNADCAPATQVPGSPWSDPLKPAKVCDQTIPFIAVVPKGGTGPFKTVIFGHGLARSKEDLLAIAGALASKGFASVAIDAVDSGSRAVQITTDAALGCDPATSVGAGKPCATALSATCAPQCYAPILTADLAVTRDNLRQTVLDQLKLERVLKYCGTQSACGMLWVDPAHIGYLGQSLGSLIGAVTVAVSPDVKNAVFNVGAADWVQVFSDTPTDAIRCPIIDALIDGGLLHGAKWGAGPMHDPMALCLDPAGAWKTDPGFIQFAQSARWVLDPVDAVNYVGAYQAASGANALLAEVIGDQVVPNSATDELGALLGLTPTDAAVATAVPPTAPSPAAPMPGSQWIRYRNLPADMTSGFPGNSYAHGSLLQPATPLPDQSGLLGTSLMQTDTLTYLVTHL
jgi:dienelactone hydrolase